MYRRRSLEETVLFTFHFQRELSFEINLLTKTTGLQSFSEETLIGLRAN